jgi:hypothetical protein
VLPAGVPRIRTFWAAPSPLAPLQPVAAPPPAARAADPAEPVDAARLRLRLRSLERALSDLPRQARRLARRLAGLRGRASKAGTPARSPLRLGRPPGFRQRPDREVDLTLRELHALACMALRPDTS